MTSPPAGQFGVVCKAVLVGSPTPAVIAAFAVESRLQQHRHSEGAIMGGPLRSLSYHESQHVTAVAPTTDISGSVGGVPPSLPRTGSVVSSELQSTYDLAGSATALLPGSRDDGSGSRASSSADVYEVPNPSNSSNGSSTANPGAEAMPMYDVMDVTGDDNAESAGSSISNSQAAAAAVAAAVPSSTLAEEEVKYRPVYIQG